LIELEEYEQSPRTTYPLMPMKNQDNKPTDSSPQTSEQASTPAKKTLREAMANAGSGLHLQFGDPDVLKESTEYARRRRSTRQSK